MMPTAELLVVETTTEYQEEPQEENDGFVYRSMLSVPRVLDGTQVNHLRSIAKVGFGTKPASWILVWLRAHGSFPGFVLETPRRGRQKRKARSLGFCILYKVIRWPGFVLSPTFWRKQSTMSGFVHLINGKRGV
jgi:hypothetical protein